MRCLLLAAVQVHKARLQDGRQVAVKVQYPGLRGAANADLSTLSCLSRWATLVTLIAHPTNATALEHWNECERL
jgi:predicted unusual protein kinase regulating ubiquinone biosynthesis (AarF/ABC1/UbiB family)